MEVETGAHDTTLADTVLTIAGRFHGVVFGSYVRDVVVPRISDPSCEVSFGPVDIWFACRADGIAFIEEMEFFVGVMAAKFTFRRLGLFGSSEHYAVYDGVRHELIHVHISETYPMTGFDVDRLGFTYLDEGKKKAYSEHLDSDRLITAIRNKTAVMSPSYVKKIISNPNESQVDYINTEFLSEGWSVFCCDQEKLPDSIDDKWVTTVLREKAKIYLNYLS